ncbi:MAG: acetoin utilization protein AcuC [Gammaproteobacteria bacterium]|nr:acetoin utilization protein AcuC [Gammaproteobacteria bacterium]
MAFLLEKKPQKNLSHGSKGAMSVASRRAVFIAAERYRKHSYGANHPLGIPRVSLTYDLIKALNAIGSDEFVPSRMASEDELLMFHTAPYLQAMRLSEEQGRVSREYRQRFNIGTAENPWFPGFYTTPATATGGSIQAAEYALRGIPAFSPAGGMHHALPDKACGFCFFNDPALAILRLRGEGLRVLYLDIDAHHGDGVEYAFWNDDSVLTFSIHMDTGKAYPFSGGHWDQWGENGLALNVPLPEKTNDSEYRYVFTQLWQPMLQSFKPQAIVLQAGTDILMPDPLGKFSISTQLFLEVLEQVLKTAPLAESGGPRLAVLGGGGYHPLALARCWAGVWAVLSGRELSDELPSQAGDLLRAVEWDLDEDEDYFSTFFQRRFDAAQEGEIRSEIRELIQRIGEHHPLFR